MILCNMALPVVGSPIDLRSMTGCLLGERYVLLRHCSFMPAAHIRDPPIRHEWVTGGRTACGTIARRFLTQLFLNGWTTYIRLLSCFIGIHKAASRTQTLPTRQYDWIQTL